MKNKTLAIFGIVTYVLGVLSSALEGKSIVLITDVFIAISGIATIVFTIMAIVRLWKIKAKGSSIIFALSEISLFILLVAQVIASPSYGNPIILLLNIAKIFNLITLFWVISILWGMANQEGLAKNNIKNFGNKYGLTPEEVSLVQKDSQKGNQEAVLQRLTSIQEQNRRKYKEATGVDIKDVIIEIGREISWADIVNHVFRVLEFDRSDTTIDQNNQVKAKSSFRPYGYLLAESPILNSKVRIPIIHRDDFFLTSSVFDEPKLAGFVADEELLVTYSPKRLLPKGLSGSPHHVLHYVITPRGTLNSYYSINNDIHMAKPEPQKLFGSFVYKGYIKVQVNREPKL
jgi:hypothetical protein